MPPEDQPQSLETRVTRVEVLQETYDKRLDGVEKDIAELHRAIRDSETLLTARIDRVAEGLGSKLDAVRQDISNAFQVATRNIPPNIAVALSVAAMVMGAMGALIVGGIHF